MKILHIEKCKECRYFYDGMSSTDECTLSGEMFWDIHDQIPDWCRLKDVHPIDQPMNYDNIPKSKTGMYSDTLTLDGGFLGWIEVHYSYLPPEDDTDSLEELEINTILINNHALSLLSQQYWVDALIYYDPRMVGHNPELYTIENIIKFKIKNDLYQQELSR